MISQNAYLSMDFYRSLSKIMHVTSAYHKCISSWAHCQSQVAFFLLYFKFNCDLAPKLWVQSAPKFNGVLWASSNHFWHHATQLYWTFLKVILSSSGWGRRQSVEILIKVILSSINFNVLISYVKKCFLSWNNHNPIVLLSEICTIW